jgi:hypothetical protein
MPGSPRYEQLSSTKQVPSSQDLGPPPLHTPGYHSEQVSVDPDGIVSPDEKLST